MSNSQSSKVEQGREKYFFRASAEDFKKIPGSPVAYWVSNKVLEIFENSPSMGDVADARQGLATADNNRFGVSDQVAEVVMPATSPALTDNHSRALRRASFCSGVIAASCAKRRSC